ARHHEGRGPVEGVLRARRRRRRAHPGCERRDARQAPALPGPRPRLRSNTCCNHGRPRMAGAPVRHRLGRVSPARNPLRLFRASWRLVVETVKSCLRYRVTGLAAEAAFFAVLSIPPLIFALAGSVGFFADRFTDEEVTDIRAGVLRVAAQVMTDSAVDKVIRPTINTVLDGGRFDV